MMMADIVSFCWSPPIIFCSLLVERPSTLRHGYQFYYSPASIQFVLEIFAVGSRIKTIQDESTRAGRLFLDVLSSQPSSVAHGTDSGPMQSTVIAPHSNNDGEVRSGSVVDYRSPASDSLQQSQDQEADWYSFSNEAWYLWYDFRFLQVILLDWRLPPPTHCLSTMPLDKA
jgi:hypothetical protein